MSDKKKILIVDDEADVVTYLSTLLEDAGYAIETATDGKQCMEAVRASRPDLITLDMTMPEQSGVKTYRELKEKNPELADIPVIVVTAIGDEMERFLESRKQVPKPEGFMSKPIDKDELLEMISGLLSR
jgi:CheY-like chemotaxis protein